MKPTVMNEARKRIELEQDSHVHVHGKKTRSCGNIQLIALKHTYFEFDVYLPIESVISSVSCLLHPRMIFRLFPIYQTCLLHPRMIFRLFTIYQTSVYPNQRNQLERNSK